MVSIFERFLLNSLTFADRNPRMPPIKLRTRGERRRHRRRQRLLLEQEQQKQEAAKTTVVEGLSPKNARRSMADVPYGGKPRLPKDN